MLITHQQKGPLKLYILICIFECIWEKKMAYRGFLFTNFILNMWFTVYEFALFLQPYVAAEQRTPLSLFQLSSTLYTSLFLSFQVGESCKCAVSLPTPTPSLSKALRCSRHLCFSSHFFSSLIKKSQRAIFQSILFTGGIQTQQSKTKKNRQQNKPINNEMQMCD